MSAGRFTTEVRYSVYDDETGEFVSVGPDSDSLDLVELRQQDTKEHIQGRIILTVNQARQFHTAIGKYLDGLPTEAE